MKSKHIEFMDELMENEQKVSEVMNFVQKHNFEDIRYDIMHSELWSIKTHLMKLVQMEAKKESDRCKVGNTENLGK